MKIFLTTLLLIASCYVAQAQNSVLCLPDKGIKSAQRFMKAEGEKAIHIEDIYYDKEGRPMLRKNPRDGSETGKTFENGRLVFLTSTRKQLPGIYLEEKKDSLLASAPTVTDTAWVISHYDNGEVKAFNQPDGTTTAFGFKGCEEEIVYFISERGDTVYTNQTSYENNLVQKVVYTYLQPIESTRSSSYSDYKFNRKGHWIERKVTTDRRVFIESRKLRDY